MLAVAACARERPARLIAGIADTVIVNTSRPVAIPLDVVDSAGRMVRSPRPRFQWLSGDSLQVSRDGQVTCTHSGDATVRASLSRVSTTFVLYCRPIRGFDFGPRAGSYNYALFVGGASKALDVVGRGTDGHPVTLLAARLSVRDSQIASLDHGRVSGRRPGETLVQVESGDSRARLHIEVIQLVSAPAELRPYRAFAARVRLEGGETENWHVPGGRYELRFIPDSDGHGQVFLAATNSNCARYSDGGPHLSCVARADATVVLGNPQATGPGGTLTGKLMVRCLSDSSAGLDYWFDGNPPS